MATDWLLGDVGGLPYQTRWRYIVLVLVAPRTIPIGGITVWRECGGTASFITQVHGVSGFVTCHCLEVSDAPASRPQ